MLRSLFKEVFVPIKETSKYDFQINNLRRVKKLATDDMDMQYRWLVSDIAKAGENAPWVNGATIYKPSLKFDKKAWWLLVKHQITTLSNDNTLGATNAFLEASLVTGVDLNIVQIITEAI